MTVTFDVKPNLRVNQDRKASGGIQISHDLGNDVTLKVRVPECTEGLVRAERREIAC